MSDPLAGHRQDINENPNLSHLVWSGRSSPDCPVNVGDVYQLRTCAIEITRTERKRAHGAYTHIAWFTRLYAEQKPWYLDCRGGLTQDRAAAMEAPYDPDAATLDGTDWPDRSVEQQAVGVEPEPEAVAPHEVRHLPTSVAAEAKFAEAKREETERRLQRSLVEEVREQFAEARRDGRDVTAIADRVREALRAA